MVNHFRACAGDTVAGPRSCNWSEPTPASETTLAPGINDRRVDVGSPAATAADAHTVLRFQGGEGGADHGTAPELMFDHAHIDLAARGAGDKAA